MKSRKKVISILLILALIFTLTPVSPFVTEADADTVTCLDDLIQAVEETTAEGAVEIGISGKIQVDGDIKIDSKSVIIRGITQDAELVMNGGSFVCQQDNAVESLTLENLKITGSQDVFKQGGGIKTGDYKDILTVDGCIINLTNANLMSPKTNTYPVLYIKSGEISLGTGFLRNDRGRDVYYCPKGDITVTARKKPHNMYFIHQENYKVGEVIIDENNLTGDDMTAINGSSESSPYKYGSESIQYSSIIIRKETPKINAGGSKTDANIAYAWSYGGTVTPESNGSFKVKPYQADGVNYVIDSIVVDGVSQTIDDRNGCTVTGVQSSIFVSFAYTVNFKDPANGTLSVSRDGKQLKSGDIVRGGEILEITCIGTSADWECNTIHATGMKGNKENNFFIVTAKNGDPTPAVSATMRPVKTVAAPTFNIESGTVIKPGDGQILYINDIEPGASVYYTLDGSDPTEESFLYNAETGITDFAGKTVKAVAVMENCNNSPVITATYEKAKEYYLSVGKNDEFKDVPFDLRIIIAGSEYTGTVTRQITSLKTSDGETLTDKTQSQDSDVRYLSAYTGDTIKFKPEIPKGYKLFDINVGGTALTAGVDGWYTFTVGTSGSISVTAYKLVKVSVLPTIENGTVTTNFDNFVGGYTGHETAIDRGYIVVNPVAAAGYRLKSGSLKYRYEDTADEEHNWFEIEYTAYDINQWRFKPARDTVIKAEFEEGDTRLEISNEEQLRAFAADVNNGNQYTGWLVTLTDDIKLTEEWTPVGEYKLVGNTYYQREFNGVFDGQGHTVSGLSINTDADEGYFGLFGNASDIKNVTVRGSINCDGIKSPLGGGKYYIGGIAGYARNVTNCTSYVDITTRSAGHTGGIAGHLSSASGCMNYGDVTVDRSKDKRDSVLPNEWVGGIAGSSDRSISRSANYGDISFDAGEFKTGDTGQGLAGVALDGTASSTGGFGGIAGYAPYGTFTDVVNRGNITGHMRLAGGIIGNAGQSGQTLTNCYNTGSITSTGDHYPNHEIRLGGIVGSNAFCQSDLTLNNCYSTGNVTAAGEGNIAVDEIQANEADRNRTGAKTDAVFILNSTYGPSAIGKMSADELMNALNKDNNDGYTADTTGINGGLPVLKWESSVNVSDDTHAVDIRTNPSDATVTVTDFNGKTVDVSKGLKMGTYHYRAVKAGYLDAEGSFTVTTKDKTVNITLYKKATIRFEITPADATFTLVDGYGKQINPVSGNTYELGVGGSYVYNAVKDGYNGAGGVIEVKGDETVKITLTKAAETDKIIYGDKNAGKTSRIETGGIYRLGEGATGLVTVATSEAVTLLGAGTASSNRFDDLYIDCTKAGSTLTLENVYIDVQTGRTNVIDFTGTGNTLNFSGTNIIDLDTNAFGCAMVHVPKGTSLKVTGGTAYLYKREQGAMFGGNGGAKGTEGQSTETNGDITVSGATIFAKNTKQGALFGAGAGAGSSLVPGSIKIENSELYLIANSRAAAIGGSAGSNGASPGADVTVTDSNITINVDYTGAAIGGGGYANGNDAGGGTLKVSNSSIRTYIDANAKDLWKVAGAGVNGNRAITADIKDMAGNPLYLAQIDTSGLSKAAIYTVKAGNTTVYSGGLHRYASVNENYEKDSQSRIDYTPNNWYSLNDSSLYVYLKGETQELTVNRAKFKAEFDASAKKFTVSKVIEAVNEVTVIRGDTTEVAVPVDVKTDGKTATVTVTDKVAEEMLKQAKENKADEISFTVTGDAAGKADRINLALDTKVVKDIAENTTADVSVNTPAGNMTFDKAALDQIAKEAKGSTVEITIEKVKEPDKASKALVGETGQIFSLTVKSGDKTISRFNGSVIIQLPIPEALKSKNIAAVHINGGKLLRIEGKVVGDKYQITVTHFSEYALVDADAVKLDDKADEDNTADAAKVKSLTKELKLKASTSLTSKKNVKVTAKVTKGSIKEITDLGYKVKYKYYRSVKKTSKYKAVKTKTTKTYINTKGSKNKKYYYKVKVCVYDKDGRLAASTALTQCRYGCRVWKK